MKPRLSELSRCFQGVFPAVIGTCSAEGEPNVTYLSHVQYVDEEHVALSCQFFNKTRRNVDENPFATVLLYDPVEFRVWRVVMRLERIETAGPLFDAMSARIDVIASHTGMAGVFKLISADVYRVLDLEEVEGFLAPPDPVIDAQVPESVPGPMSEIRGLHAVSMRIARAGDLDALLGGALEALDENLGFAHSMVLLADECTGKLVTIASRGYGERGFGAEVTPGQGVIGQAAEKRRMLKMSGVRAELRYGRAIRKRAHEVGEHAGLGPEIPLPGLPDAQVQLALPLMSCTKLVGVLAVESEDAHFFDEWDEAFLQIVANQIALGVDRMQTIDEEADGGAKPAAKASKAPLHAANSARKRSFVYYRNDDCVFVDGEYLIRNIPGKILWKVLRKRVDEGQKEFTNRELRLDPALGLPPIKDNLESRLILLKKRLAEKCPDVRMVPIKRGRFALEIDGDVTLAERDQA
jgi:hypothetical protein